MIGSLFQWCTKINAGTFPLVICIIDAYLHMKDVNIGDIISMFTVDAKIGGSVQDSLWNQINIDQFIRWVVH